MNKLLLADLRFSFNEEKTKNDFLSHVHIKSNEYNITLNEHKTFVEKYPAKNELNKTPLFSFFENFNSTDYLKWIDKLYDYVVLCIDEESKGNKGSIKILFTGSLFPLQGSSLVNEIFTYRSPLNNYNYNLFEHFLDISLKDSKLANRFLNFTKKLISSGVDQESLNQIVSEFFEENSRKIRRKINTCIENKYNQEVYQLLLYYLYFEVYENINQTQLTELIGEISLPDEDRQGFLIKIIDFNNDDLSNVLAVTIYLQIVINEFLEVADYDAYDFYMDKLFEKLDHVLSESYKSYLPENDRETNPYDVPDTSRMTEKLWFLRYHIYYLTNKYTRFKESLNKYFKNNEIPQTKRNAYKSQLNWPYVKTNKKIDEFYNMMLDGDVALFNFEFDNYVEWMHSINNLY